MFYLKIVLNTILTNQFQNYLLPIFIVQKLLKFCIQLTTNPMEVFMVLYFYLQSSFMFFFYEYVKNCLNYKLDFW
jgi:hypothetical protein